MRPERDQHSSSSLRRVPQPCLYGSLICPFPGLVLQQLQTGPHLLPEVHKPLQTSCLPHRTARQHSWRLLTWASSSHSLLPSCFSTSFRLPSPPRRRITHHSMGTQRTSPDGRSPGEASYPLPAPSYTRLTQASLFLSSLPYLPFWLRTCVLSPHKPPALAHRLLLRLRNLR